MDDDDAPLTLSYVYRAAPGQAAAKMAEADGGPAAGAVSAFAKPPLRDDATAKAAASGRLRDAGHADCDDQAPAGAHRLASSPIPWRFRTLQLQARGQKPPMVRCSSGRSTCLASALLPDRYRPLSTLPRMSIWPTKTYALIELGP